MRGIERGGGGGGRERERERENAGGGEGGSKYERVRKTRFTNIRT